ncbi:MAG: hypothetical protein Q8O67_17735 [Deltaproteobacteria bacterium]|nr:hypothetical protein [Deltaproteobacteria bacterium]
MIRVVVVVVVVVLLCSRAASAAVDENSATLLTELVANALGTEARLEVVSSADLRRQLEVEANKQSLGCDASATSCLAEIAGAMGAQVVVYGKLGALSDGDKGDVVILTLNLFDSTQGRAVGRIALRDVSLAGLGAQVDDGVARLVAPFVLALPEGTRAKLLVLDIEPPKKSEASVVVVEPVAATPPLFIAGVSGVVGGVVVAGLGVGLYFVAADRDRVGDDPTSDAIKSKDAYDARDRFGAASVIALALGGAAAVAGGIAVGFAE